MKIFLAKQLIKGISKKIKRSRDKKELEGFRDMAIQIKQIAKEQAKHGRDLENHDIDIAILKKDAHPKKDFVKCGNCKCKTKENEC
jgi:hypothetical protein